MSIDAMGCSLTRRELLRRSGMGFAMLGFTGALSDAGRLIAAAPGLRTMRDMPLPSYYGGR